MGKRIKGKRLEKLKAMLAEGKKTSEIAKALRVREDTVREWKAKLRVNGNGKPALEKPKVETRTLGGESENDRVAERSDTTRETVSSEKLEDFDSAFSSALEGADAEGGAKKLADVLSTAGSLNVEAKATIQPVSGAPASNAGIGADQWGSLWNIIVSRMELDPLSESEKKVLGECTASLFAKHAAKFAAFQEEAVFLLVVVSVLAPRYSKKKKAEKEKEKSKEPIKQVMESSTQPLLEAAAPTDPAAEIGVLRG